MTNFLNCTKVKSSKNFESKVLKFFPKTEERDIYIDTIGMRRNRGFGGAYETFLEMFVGSQRLSFSLKHNDSVGWDNYTDWSEYDRAYQNWAKSTILYLLEENKEQIEEFYLEEIGL